MVSQDPLQLCLGKWRRGGFLQAKIPLSVIITDNDNTGFIVIPFCIWEPCGVCCIQSACHVYLFSLFLGSGPSDAISFSYTEPRVVLDLIRKI